MKSQKEYQVEQERLRPMRHSLAHIMAQSIIELWPGTELGIGPVIEDGFYYDVLLPDGQQLQQKDLAKITKRMHQIIKADLPFRQEDWSISRAKDFFADQPFKLELIADLEQRGTTKPGQEAFEGKDLVGVYITGDEQFIDLCGGPHEASTGKVGKFKLTRVAGAYWRGDNKNPQLQRVYGVAFASDQELEEYFVRLEEAKKRDHRVLGEKLKLFMHSDKVGAGLPILLPRGEQIKDLLIRYMRQLEQAKGYQYISTPVLTHEALYQASGHADYYLDNMYCTEVDEEGNRFYLKPMNCPHHHQVYERLVQSYRDLPLRLAEASPLYRYELSGTLTGLIRVRGPITQNDAHIYVTPDQLKAEFIKVIDLFSEVYQEFEIEDYWFRLSLPDFGKDKFTEDGDKWQYAADQIREALFETGSEFVEAEGEAAFYGPKLDVQIRNVMGKEDTIATSQIDILVPGRMGLKYIDQENQEQTPIVIHRAIMGSFERFIGFLLEKTGGYLPFWLAPEQVRILIVTDKAGAYVGEIESVLSSLALNQPLQANQLRYKVDDRAESLGKKIRQAEQDKIPVQIIVGEKDQENRTISLRKKFSDKSEEQTIEFDQLANYLSSLAESRGKNE
ncbi:threonine--tRNA ligase [Candidatus Saccharibacteria bacterium]|nr:threonine--tRNA ligase [Candidatus Saccharibacteria bacterium]MCB9834527.1 threonine--tRNA ligase [Candidatus Nomurabacteria bacterium]